MIEVEEVYIKNNDLLKFWRRTSYPFIRSYPKLLISEAKSRESIEVEHPKKLQLWLAGRMSWKIIVDSDGEKNSGALLLVNPKTNEI